MHDLVRAKIINDKNILFFDTFINIKGGKADIEDVFEKEEYIRFYNEAYSNEKPIVITDLDSNIPKIISQINKLKGITHFNHYKPANKLAQLAPESTDFSKDTLDRFENIFKRVNSLI